MQHKLNMLTLLNPQWYSTHTHTHTVLRTLSFTPSGDVTLGSTGNNEVLLWKADLQDFVVDERRAESTEQRLRSATST